MPAITEKPPTQSQTSASPSKSLLNGRYQIIADINKGSYGVVSLAKDIGGDGSLVAIKCITKSSNCAVYEEALYEVEMHKRLGNHPNIVQLIDFFDENSKAYLVLEYCAPGDLYEAIKAGRGPREQNCVLDFMLQLIDSVEYCHSKGVYHRDIKPENILIGNDGSVKLADWGLATCTKINGEFGIGSERYMAPELFDQANTKEYDAEKADIWALGICLLNILFGRNPFTVASQKDKLFLDFATAREALFDIFPSLSEDVFAALRHCLTMDPDNRSLSKLRKELLAVRMWTTDEYYEDEDVYDDDEFGLNLNDNEINEYEQQSNNEKTTKNNDDFEDNDDTVVGGFVKASSGALATVHGGSISAANGEHEPFATKTPGPHHAPSPLAIFQESLAVPQDFISTTTNRQPFRTPTGLVNHSPLRQDLDWNRTMQFTPPTRENGFFPNSKVKTPSNLSFVLSARGGNGSGFPMQSVGEDDESGLLESSTSSASRSRRGSDGSTNSIIDDEHHEDVFAMDGELSGSFNKLSLNSGHNNSNIINGGARAVPTSNERAGSGSDSSISSVPSLVKSTTLEEASLPSQRFTFNGASASFTPSNMTIPKMIVQGASPERRKTAFLASSAPPVRDFLNLGKSWSDIDFEDDDDADFVEDDFYYNKLRNAVPAGTGTVTSVSGSNSQRLDDAMASKETSAVSIKPMATKSRLPAIAGKSHPTPGQSWVYPHWVE
ncbi:putative serine/threonine protein kinase KSP1 [Sugiyamaella lignohabitans]|uniref:Putative serine/threonine protein kinase KSP1 n=1 Tax=Sugiyamaella lignohabitans TaxID=796027 RepID=A0A167CMP5_9ASCO|nr:putative serine/threonine protein kinase KSP1 [Sugiyamaella lignohabitans]ANB11894.1 putative serine/threonine protein kinase KSP1 [Sugiyamaella lignohabitans]